MDSILHFLLLGLVFIFILFITFLVQSAVFMNHRKGLVCFLALIPVSYGIFTVNNQINLLSQASSQQSVLDDNSDKDKNELSELSNLTIEHAELKLQLKKQKLKADIEEMKKQLQQYKNR